MTMGPKLVGAELPPEIGDIEKYCANLWNGQADYYMNQWDSLGLDQQLQIAFNVGVDFGVASKN